MPPSPSLIQWKHFPTAYDLETGEVEWTAKWDGAITVPGYAMADGSWIKATLVLAEDSLVVLGMLDDVICLEPDTGKIGWKAGLTERFNARRPPFGGVCSPLIDDGAVYVIVGRQRRNDLRAFEQ